MRIEPSILIKITGRRTAAGPLGGLQKGSELSAIVVRRLNAREAVLEIGGKRIHAEFKKGLPSAGTVLLRLEDVKNNAYIFRIIGPPGMEESVRQILNNTIFNAMDIEKNIFSGLANFFSKPPAGIFELNAFLLNMIAKQDKKEDRLTLFLNSLLKLGLDKDISRDLSVFLSDAGGDLSRLRTLLAALGLDSGDQRGRRKKEEDVLALVNDIIGAIEGIEDDAARNETIQRLLQFLTRPDGGESGYRWGEIPCYRDGAFYPVRYIGKGGSWVFSLEYSNIGRVDILAREMRGANNIAIYCANDAVLDVFRGSEHELLQNIKSIRPPVYINFYNMQNFINKIVEIYSYSPPNSVLDVKA